MKRIFYTLVVAMAAMSAHATDYTDQLLVLVNGEGATQEATISVNEHNGLYDLNLKNFVLMNGEQPLYVGNVELKDIAPEKAGDAIFLRTSKDITVTNGDLPEVPFWVGPMLGALPVQIAAVVDANGLRALIDLDLTETLQQVVNVSFGKPLVSGTGYHIPNGGFEDWHASAEGYVEPNAWHSFESASGQLAPLAGHHIEKSDDGRNGACARVFSTSIFGIIANGTMTTGRMNAGSMVASDPANHAYMDMSLEDTDGNKDPFYVALGSRPDSLVLYMQFHQGKAVSEHPYATVSAVITDGTLYKEPEDKDYDNVVARAQNNKIAVTGNEWTRISIPFVYTDNNVEPRAIMVTISTNADAGQGSKEGDEVLVDDLTLVYNSRLSALNIEGFQADKFEYNTTSAIDPESITAEADGAGAYVLKTVSEDDAQRKVVIDVFAADLRSHNTYTMTFDKEASAIAPSHQATTLPATYYNLKGQKVDCRQKGQVVIARQADGMVSKVLR